jgi:DUF1016 N-terminal domain
MSRSWSSGDEATDETGERGEATGRRVTATSTTRAPAGKFDEVLSLIEAARQRAYQAVNVALVGLYWQLGQYISKTKDDEVVEYTLARTTSPTLVAEYQTMLPTKALLRRKLHELYAHLAPEGSSATPIEEALRRMADGEPRRKGRRRERARR